LTFADSLPTLDGMKRTQRSKPGTVTVGNVKVQIYKRQRLTTTGKKRTIFEVADYSSGVRRFRGFSDAGKAKREAEKIAGQLATGQTTAATMTNSAAASYGRAVELLRPFNVSLELAAAKYAKAFEIRGGDFVVEDATFCALHRADKITRRTVAEVVAELIAAKEARDKSTRYIADLRARLARFAGDFAVDISSVTGPDVQGWLDRLKLAPRTARNFRACLCTLFSFAESRGYILKGSNAATDTEEISTADGGAIEIYTPAEMLAMLNAAPKDFAPVIAIGGFAGLRTAEIERLDWRDIDLTSGFITVAKEKAKTRSRRLVPILPNLSAWLAPLAGQNGKVWKGTANTINDARAETAKAAKTPWKNNALRHSFISYRLASIQDAAKVSLEAGNSPAMVFRHYRELVKPTAAKAWFAIAPEGPANIVSMTATAAVK
jgi:integrase